jgi:transcriptional regulator with XRE-family HTH domain
VREASDVDAGLGRIASQLGDARRQANLSLREIGRMTGMGHELVGKIEAGDTATLTIDRVARFAETVGLELAATLYPSGDPVRDRAHLALLRRFRERIGPSLSWRTEVPVPIAGDLRSGDAVLGYPGGDALVEAETHLGDLQLIERRSAAKQRDLGASRLVLLVSDTRHNRQVIRHHPELRERFPTDSRTCLRLLARAEDPGGDALVVL